jgi:hypothetical protein
MQSVTTMLIMSVLLLAGCVSSAVDDNYGRAVTQMRDAQVYDRSTLNPPGDHAVQGIDPESAGRAIEALRADTADRGAVRKGTPVAVSSQQGGGSP